jgi:NAD-dependent deacetylase
MALVSNAAIAELAQALHKARRITILTGAGVSAASGVPTFRGADGLWNQIRASTIATPEAFAGDPRLVWEWYDWRRSVIRDTLPNPAHHLLASWTRVHTGVTVITQNVDGLHERAGTDRLIRLHGSLWHVRCHQACPAGATAWIDDRVPLPALPPPCPHCGGYLRPAVTWFGEPLDEASLSAAARAAVCDVFLSVGTSAVVHPAASLIPYAMRHGALVAELNIAATPAHEFVDLAISGPAEETLAAIDAAWTTIRG